MQYNKKNFLKHPVYSQILWVDGTDKPFETAIEQNRYDHSRDVETEYKKSNKIKLILMLQRLWFSSLFYAMLF